ncbi:MAG: single-stranded-DNA-specific exonuclease RecJ [Candidatus Gastranaerophilales bacterium]|nr:single-stranded-DNA-specific exonuclease RecJ [Candidatus Gastranaerophilales bacterium]
MKYRKIAVKEKTKNIYHHTKDSFLNELLSLRGLENEIEVEKFLNPSRKDFISPFAFSDMKKATERIFQAIEKEQTILIWGDFDCDGVTSSAVLYKALNALNAKVISFIPDRLLHGHGLNSKELIKLISKEKVKLVITVDCAISNVSEVNLLKGLGVDTIITDHHSTDGDLPNAYAIINPQVNSAIDEKTSFEDITSMTYNSGSVVAYKLAMALLEQIDNDDLKDELLVIASCGAVADVVPLIGENRAMVSTTLELLNNKKEKSHSAIYELLKRNVGDKPITSYDIAFVLAPRINAVGRLANAKLSFEFLTTKEEIKYQMIIEQLDNYNKIRQGKCAETYDEIIEYLKKHKEEKNNPAIILINPDWHIGIIGIVASKIVEEFNKPCFLMTIDENNNARCSIRSNDVINVYDVLKENETLFSGFGGHKLAGGCSFNLNEMPFEKVKEALLKTIKDLTVGIKVEDTLLADVELSFDELDVNILETLDKLEPFGQNNEPPLLACFNVNLDEFKLIGKEQNHLRMIFSSNDKKIQAVKWNEGELQIPFNSKCDIAFYPRLNEFNGVQSIQLEIVDIYSESISKQFKNEFKIYDHRKKVGILDQIASYFERNNLDVAIWAKQPSTKEILSKYQKIKDNFIQDLNSHDGLMFFDYPSNKDEFVEILSSIKPNKIHFMNCNIDENLENYIKQLNGMIKYCANKLDGAIDLARFSQALGVSENFIQITLEILENIESIKILDIDKMEYIKPFNYDDFKQDSMFEILKEEFESIINFKKTLLNCNIKEIENIVVEVVS